MTWNMNQKKIMKNYGLAAAYLVIIVHCFINMYMYIYTVSVKSLQPLLKNELLSTDELSPLISWLALISERIMNSSF